ncbi:MAG TPA: hypothetical protein VI386_29285 [Candidatus Sulfotelmatobacter sp.]
MSNFMRPIRKRLAALLLLFTSYGAAEPVKVKYAEGSLHAFMLLRTQEGKVIAVGDLDQTVQGAKVTARLSFHFQDGSIREQTTVFSQRGVFRLLSDHILEKGPAFKNSVDVWINCPSGQVKVRDMKDGPQRVTTHHVDIPADLANGIVPTLIKNFPDNAKRTLTMVIATPKPRVVKLVVTPERQDLFSVAGQKYTAKEHVLKVDIGGVAGAVAPVVGKQPPDTYLWIYEGETPVFVKSLGPLYAEGPIWQVELAAPTWGKH